MQNAWILLHQPSIEWPSRNHRASAHLDLVQGVKMAQPLTGPLMQQYQSLARSVGIWLSLGGFQESCPADPNRLCNCHVIVDDQGSIRAAYRKVHLFDVEVEQGPVLMESRSTAPGTEVLPLTRQHRTDLSSEDN